MPRLSSRLQDPGGCRQCQSFASHIAFDQYPVTSLSVAVMQGAGCSIGLLPGVQAVEMEARRSDADITVLTTARLGTASQLVKLCHSKRSGFALVKAQAGAAQSRSSTDSSSRVLAPIGWWCNPGGMCSIQDTGTIATINRSRDGSRSSARVGQMFGSRRYPSRWLVNRS